MKWFPLFTIALVVSVSVYALFLHGVIDELLTLVAYCGRTCGYPFPWSGPLQFYIAEEEIDAIIDVSVAGMIGSVIGMMKTYGK